MIAVANVFNTISTNIKLRRRELAMLRSVGMSDRDFNKMMRFECVLYGAQWREHWIYIPMGEYGSQHTWGVFCCLYYNAICCK